MFFNKLFNVVEKKRISNNRKREDAIFLKKDSKKQTSSVAPQFQLNMEASPRKMVYDSITTNIYDRAKEEGYYRPRKLTNYDPAKTVSWSLEQSQKQIGNYSYSDGDDDKPESNPDYKRSVFDRLFSPLNVGQYTVQGAMRGMVDKDMTPLEGIARGLKASNPFGKGHKEYQYQMSDTLELVGWKPKSTAGNVAKGAVGFAGDVLLDPLTYVSGGTSALFQGSGKHAAKGAKYVDNIGDLGKGVGMTQEVAEGLVKKSSVFKNSDEALDVAKEGSKLLKEYNKAMGINVKDASKTLSLANAPFGKKIFGRFADKKITLVDSDTMKKIGDHTLAPVYGSVRRNFMGSKLGGMFSNTSKVYKLAKDKPEQVYNFLKYNEMTVGNTADKLLKEKNIRKTASMLGGMKPSEQKDIIKTLDDKTVWSKVKANIRFVDTKEASAFKTKIEASKLATVGRVEAVNKYKKQVDSVINSLDGDVLEKSKALKALELEHIDNLTNLNSRYAVNAGKFKDVNKALDRAEMFFKNDAVDPEDLVKRFRGEDNRVASDFIKGVKEEGLRKKFNINDVYKVKDTIVDSPVMRAHKDLSVSEIRSKVKFSKDIINTEAAGKTRSLSSLNKLQSEVRKTGYKEYNSKGWADKLAKDFPDWIKTEVDGKIRLTPPSVQAKGTYTGKAFKQLDRQAKGEFIDDLSKYIFGKDGVLSKNTYPDRVEDVVRMIDEGKRVEDIAHHIFENKMDYNGAASEMNTFIAKTIGYDRWDDKFTKPMEKILKQEKNYNNAVERLEKLRKSGDVEAVKNFVLPEKPSEVQMLQLKQLNLKREALKADFRGKTTLEEVSEVIGKFNEVKFDREISDVMESIANTSRFTAENTKRDTWNIEAFMDEYKTGAKRQFQKEFKSNTWDLGEDLEEELMSHLSDKYKMKPWEKHSDLNFYKHVKNEVAENSKKFRSSLYDMDNVARDEMYDRAYKNIYRQWKNGGLEELEPVEKLKYAAKDMKVDKLKRTIDNQKAMRDSVGRNNKIQFNRSGKRASGVVESVTFQDGKKVLRVAVDDGSYETIHQSKILARLGNAEPKTLDDIKNTSQLYNNFVNRQAELQDSIESTLSKANLDNAAGLKKVNADKHNSLYTLNKNYKSKLSKTKEEMMVLEGKLSKARADGAKDFSKFVSEQASDIKKFDDALSDADAFDSFVKLNFDVNQDTIDSVVTHYNPKLGEYVLKPKSGLEDDVAEVSQMLREEFQKIGQSEVDIGSLKKAQLDAMADRYIPHILTKDGAEMFAKKEVQNHVKQFSEEFGFGREFNNFAQSRTLKSVFLDGEVVHNPTIPQINRYFKEKFPKLLKGKDVMSENIAEIYLTRALKNNDLLYDNKYMEDMLSLFGEDFDGKAVEGFRTVTNYGKLKDFTSSINKAHTSLDISDAIDAHMKDEDVVRRMYQKAEDLINSSPRTYKGITSDELANDMIRNYRNQYMKTNLTKEVRDAMYDKNFKGFLTNTNTTGMLDDFATPLAELDGRQISGLTESYDGLINRYTDRIRDKFAKYAKIGTGQKSTVRNMSIEDIEGHLYDAFDGAEGKELDRINNIFGEIKKMRDIATPEFKNVNEAIVSKANQTRKLQMVKDNNALLDTYDKFTHFIKLNQTAISPAFHARNKLSNMFNNWLAVGNDAINPKFQKTAMDAMKGKLDGEFLELAEGGKKIEWSEVVRQAEANGAIDSGVFAEEIMPGSKGNGILNKLFNGKLNKIDPTNTGEFIGYTYGTKSGNKIENHDRFVHFVSQLKNGMDFKEAGESVNKFLFDYSDLTMFEQSTMKRIFPYYTWLRKNSVLQLEMLLEKPEKFRHISRVMGGIEGLVDEDKRIDKTWLNDFAQDWVQTPFEVTNPEGRKEPVLWNPNLPFQDLNELPDPYDLGGTARSAFTKTNPMIKIPIELAMNKNVFFDNDIVKDTDYDSPTKMRAKHIASQMAIVPIADGFMNKTGADLGLHTLNNTSGIKMISYDYDKWKAMKVYQLNKKREKSNYNPGMSSAIRKRLSGY